MKQELIASVIVVGIVFLITFVTTLAGAVGGDYPEFILSAVIGGVAALVAAIVMLVWTLPVHMVFKRYGVSNIVWYVFLAIIPSFVFIFGFKPFGNDTYSDLIGQAFFCSLCGSLGAVAFWFFTVFRRHA